MQSECDVHANQVTPGSPVRRGHSEADTEELPRPMAQQEQSPIFSIPTELRLQIYEIALSTSNKDPLGVRMKCHGFSTDNPPSNLSLLATCRLILFEAEQVFYSSNRLLISSPQPFINSLKAKRLFAITRLTISVRTAGTTLTDLQLIRAKLPNLTSLWLREDSGSFKMFQEWQDLGDQLVAAMEALPRLRDAKVIPRCG